MGVQRKDLWDEDINTSFFIRSRIVKRSCRERKTPYEIIHGYRPKLDNVRIFGSRVYVHKGKESRNGKPDLRVISGILAKYCRGNA